jgi:ketosteroid isomerase-like protein
VQSIGVAYATALADKDYEQLRLLLAPEIDFRSLTPNRTWEASDSETLIREILQQWFEDSDEIRSLESIQTDVVGDRERVGYRFAVRNPEGDFLVEQQAYFSTRDGKIVWMRVMCSGFQPVG